MLLHNGVVMAKYHYHDIPALFEVEKAAVRVLGQVA